MVCYTEIVSILLMLDAMLFAGIYSKTALVLTVPGRFLYTCVRYCRQQAYAIELAFLYL